MLNTNRDYLCIIDVKNGTVVAKRPLKFITTDRNTMNIFVKLVVPIFYVDDDLIEYADMENASNYQVIMHTKKPNKNVLTTYAVYLTEGLFQLNLDENYINVSGVYSCEFAIHSTVNDTEEITTTEKFIYNVTKSIISDIEIEETEEVTNSIEALYMRMDKIEAQLSKYDLSLYAPIDNPRFTTAISLGRNPGTEIGKYSVAEGDGTVASGGNSHAEGGLTQAIGSQSHAEGAYTKANGENSHAEGYETKAIGENSHAEGYYTTANGYGSHVEGYYSEANNRYSHAEGYVTKANGEYGSHAEGYYTTASGYASHAEGGRSTASGSYSHAEGYETIASSSNSHAEGYYSQAKGDSSHAEGYYSEANGDYSHSEGYWTVASGYSSHAEGGRSTAQGDYSHAEGDSGAGGKYSHAEGNSTANGDYSHSEGQTIAHGEYQHTQGRWNIEDKSSTYAHIVGNGEDIENRSNAHTLDWNGNAWYQGDLYVGGTNQDDANKVLSTQDVYFDADGNLCVTINGVTKRFKAID